MLALPTFLFHRMQSSLFADGTLNSLRSVDATCGGCQVRSSLQSPADIELTGAGTELRCPACDVRQVLGKPQLEAFWADQIRRDRLLVQNGLPVPGV